MRTPRASNLGVTPGIGAWPQVTCARSGTRVPTTLGSFAPGDRKNPHYFRSTYRMPFTLQPLKGRGSSSSGQTTSDLCDMIVNEATLRTKWSPAAPATKLHHLRRYRFSRVRRKTGSLSDTRQRGPTGSRVTRLLLPNRGSRQQARHLGKCRSRPKLRPTEHQH